MKNSLGEIKLLNETSFASSSSDDLHCSPAEIIV